MTNFLLATQKQAICPPEASTRQRRYQKKVLPRPPWKELAAVNGYIRQDVFNVAYKKSASVLNKLQE